MSLQREDDEHDQQHAVDRRVQPADVVPEGESQHFASNRVKAAPSVAPSHEQAARNRTEDHLHAHAHTISGLTYKGYCASITPPMQVINAEINVTPSLSRDTPTPTDIWRSVLPDNLIDSQG